MASQALEIAKDADRKILSHEAICVERYTNINSKMNDIGKNISKLENIFKWAGGALFTLAFSAFGFLINQTLSANQTLQASNINASLAANRIEMLQQQLINERAAKSDMSVPEMNPRPSSRSER
jgi:hypothetical protein